MVVLLSLLLLFFGVVVAAALLFTQFTSCLNYTSLHSMCQTKIDIMVSPSKAGWLYRWKWSLFPAFLTIFMLVAMAVFKGSEHIVAVLVLMTETACKTGSQKQKQKAFLDAKKWGRIFLQDSWTYIENPWTSFHICQTSPIYPHIEQIANLCDATKFLREVQNLPLLWSHENENTRG